jgi:hypothetical protein
MTNGGRYDTHTHDDDQKKKKKKKRKRKKEKRLMEKQNLEFNEITVCNGKRIIFYIPRTPEQQVVLKKIKMIINSHFHQYFMRLTHWDYADYEDGDDKR